MVRTKAIAVSALHERAAGAGWVASVIRVRTDVDLIVTEVLVFFFMICFPYPCIQVVHQQHAVHEEYFAEIDLDDELITAASR